MIVVHHLNASRSHRILWLLEELGLSYEVRTYQRQRDLRAPNELKNVHPLGKSPVIVDDDKSIAESGAIIEYLVDVYDKTRILRPDLQSNERIRYSYWMHYAEGSLMPQLLLALVFGVLPKKPMPFFVKPIVAKLVEEVEKNLYGPELKKHMDFIEAELAKSPYLVGDKFTAADIQMSYPIENAARRFGATKGRPAIAAYIERLRQRPAYGRAIARGGAIELEY
jgi:glutathione S-transferase